MDASRILLASLVGTAIEFFDFYIYATAAVLVFPSQFFPASDPTSATLASLATFGIAFLARPIGSALFGHFGDRLGRKVTLVAALLTMGLSTVAIGLLPPYETIGIAAPALLALCRFGQGIGLGGEWGGAVLLATENAPPGQRAWYGMFPQLGAPIGFFGSGAIFLLLSRGLSDEQFLAWGWRVPFLASAVLVILGLYRFIGFSRLVFAIDATLLAFLLVGARVAISSVDEYLRRKRGTGRAVLIYGAGIGGALLVRALLEDRTFDLQPIGFIDDAPAKRRLRIEGVPVLGTFETLAAVIEQQAIVRRRRRSDMWPQLDPTVPEREKTVNSRSDPYRGSSFRPVSRLSKFNSVLNTRK